MYILNTITKEKLRFILDAAKHEIMEYTHYHETAKKISKHRKESDSFEVGCLTIGIVFCFFIGSIIFFISFLIINFHHSCGFMVSFLLYLFF